MLHKSDIMLEKYIKDIEKYPLLTPVREKELSKIIMHSKDHSEIIKARNEMVEGNLRIVVKIAIELYSRVSGLDDINVSVLDLIQAGNIGLLRAAELFSYKKNFHFCTYAYLSVMRKMKRAMMQSHFVRIPLNHFRHISRLNEIEGRLNSKALTDKEIKEELQITNDMLEMIKKEKNSKVNIEGIEGGMEYLIDENETPLDKKIESIYLRRYLYEKIKELKPFDRDVIFYKFFSNEEITLKMIGKKYGITRERVRLGIRTALRHLRIKLKADRAMGNTKLKNPIKEI